METLLIRPESNEQLKAVLKVPHIDFISKKGKQYDPEFVKKIKESRTQAKQGKVSALDTKNLWK